MNKKYATIKDLNEVKGEIQNLSSKLDNLIAALSQPKAEPQQKQPKAGTSKKSPKGTSKAAKSNDFDRSLYEATAKKLGCFAYGKVVATVVDGVKVRTREENKALVYKAMGYSK